MRTVTDDRLETGRIRHGKYASDFTFGHCGMFQIPGPCGRVLRVIASDGRDPDAHGWEHVSVSINNRPPNWQEMCFVKDLFWSDEETVLQFHPPKSQYVNYHPHCLHLWRHVSGVVELPPSILVGPKTSQ